MAHPRRARALVGRGTKRSSLWLGFAAGTTTLTASSATLINVLNAGALALRPFTVVRTHLNVSVASDQSAASELMIGAMGTIVVKTSATGIGITAVPSPITDINDDWFVFQGFSNRYEFLSAVGAARVDVQYEIDSKAMRKVDDGDDIVLVAEMQTGVGALIQITGRMLIKLH